MSDVPGRGNDRKSMIPEFSGTADDPVQYIAQMGNWQCRTVVPEELWVDVGHDQGNPSAHVWFVRNGNYLFGYALEKYKNLRFGKDTTATASISGPAPVAAH